METSQGQEKGVINPIFTGGPKNLGDPIDRRLRRVERNIIIPQIMRENCGKSLCLEELNAFGKCSERAGFSVVYSCRGVKDVMSKCMEECFKNPEMRRNATEEYLKQRAEHRITGLTKRQRELIEIDEFERETKWSEKHGHKYTYKENT